MIKSTSLCLYICSVCVFVIRKLMSYPWKEIIKQISKPLVYLECSSPPSIWLKAHSLSCISHKQVHNYSRNGPLCNNNPQKCTDFFFKYDEKKNVFNGIHKCWLKWNRTEYSKLSISWKWYWIFILDIVCFTSTGFRRRTVKCSALIIIKRINLWHKIFSISSALKKNIII